MQLSSTVYWYQVEPHAPLPPMLSVEDRQPAPEILNWPEQITPASTDELKKRGVKLEMFCGHPQNEMIYAEPGYSISDRKGQSYSDWGGDVFYCIEDAKEVDLTLNLPPGSKGVLRLYIADPDNYMGGRKETIVVGGDTVGAYDQFQKGRWIEVPVSPDRAANGKLKIQVLNNNEASNAVLSKLEWVEK
jgi:hypothetical protein